MPSIQIKSSAGPYQFVCARGVLANSASLLKRLGDHTGVFVISSPNVWHEWGRTLAAKMPGARNPILFDDGEQLKRISTVEAISRALVRAKADRHSLVVAIGGGVVGDVVGFVAASYLRGVKLVHVPTTLVAQVDSSIGGKTGVNLPEGKNLVGAFYPPKLILADPNVLQTLPHREFRSGLYEVVKYGVIADPDLFRFLEKRMPAILRRDPDSLGRIIARCAGIKADVVNKDEREGGLRQILNFGHTIGHGLEAVTGYRRFLHGEAIGWGMISATLIAVAMDHLINDDAVRIIRLIASVGPLPAMGKIHAADLRPILVGDKKARGGRVLWVLPTKIGKTKWGIDVPWSVVSRAFRETSAIAAEAGI
jgi:3-dehydroquinate synthase